MIYGLDKKPHKSIFPQDIKNMLGMGGTLP
jgi:hypothetical protein